ncbi:MAG: 50S ribosomal protein L30 [Ruminococcaceae bacterium]|nr:50S ribosomal protein L30 [Oscillospiraceae bacterium]
MSLKVTLTKSLIGRKASHIATAKSMKLFKIGDVSIQPDNAPTKGKIAEISYLIEVEEVK